MIVIKLQHVSDNSNIKSDIRNPQRQHTQLKKKNSSDYKMRYILSILKI